MLEANTLWLVSTLWPPVEPNSELAVNASAAIKLSSNFYSAEFPEWTCSSYNDFFVILLDSTYANPDVTGVVIRVSWNDLQRDDGTGFGLAVVLTAHVPGLDAATVEGIMQKAHIVCPYSHATRGNIDVQLKVS